jgi:hypothetical protein
MRSPLHFPARHRFPPVPLSLPSTSHPQPWPPGKPPAPAVITRLRPSYLRPGGCKPRTRHSRRYLCTAPRRASNPPVHFCTRFPPRWLRSPRRVLVSPIDDAKLSNIRPVFLSHRLRPWPVFGADTLLCRLPLGSPVSPHWAFGLSSGGAAPSPHNQSPSPSCSTLKAGHCRPPPPAPLQYRGPPPSIKPSRGLPPLYQNVPAPRASLRPFH